MDDELDPWSEVADAWSRYWAEFPEPVWRRIADLAEVGPGTRVLDVGCGSGQALHFFADRGATVAGVDPSPRMRELAALNAPAADLRDAGWEDLPWPDATFDLMFGVNSLAFTDDEVDALREGSRVVAPGGLVVVAGWAEQALNDLSVIEAAVARAMGDDAAPDDPEREAGGLETVLAEAGLAIVDSGVVDLPWHLADEDALAAAILLGEEPETFELLRPVVLEAAEPFRVGGGYRLVNRFRYAAGRVE